MRRLRPNTPETRRLVDSEVVESPLNHAGIAVTVLSVSSVIAVMIWVGVALATSDATPAPATLGPSVPASTSSTAPPTSSPPSTSAAETTSSPPPSTSTSQAPSTSTAAPTSTPTTTASVLLLHKDSDPRCGTDDAPCSQISDPTHGKWAVRHNGLCWAWASPCSGGSRCQTSVNLLGADNATFSPGQWEFVTDDRIRALQPGKELFWQEAARPPRCGPTKLGGDRFSRGCAAFLFNVDGMDHCDYCDDIHNPDAPRTPRTENAKGRDELLLVCGAAQLTAALDGEPPGVACPEPPTIEHGQLVNCTTENATAENLYAEYSTCAVECDATYEATFPSGAGAYCRHGQWYDLPQCVAIGCNVLPPIANINPASCSVPADVGDICNFGCTAGFAFPFAVDRICLGADQWDPEPTNEYSGCFSPSQAGCISRTTCGYCIERTSCHWCDGSNYCEALNVPCSGGLPVATSCVAVRGIPGRPDPEVSDFMTVVDIDDTRRRYGEDSAEFQVLWKTAVEDDCFSTCAADDTHCTWNRLAASGNCDYAQPYKDCNGARIVNGTHDVCLCDQFSQGEDCTTPDCTTTGECASGGSCTFQEFSFEVRDRHT